jgi:hypothetical protein
VIVYKQFAIANAQSAETTTAVAPADPNKLSCDAYDSTTARVCYYETASKLGPHTQTDRWTCPGVGL